MEKLTNTATVKFLMLYDGGCPLCSREVAHYRRVDKARQVVWADIHSDPGILLQYDICYEDAMKRLHVIDANGSIVTGARAFAIVWAQLPYYRVLAYFTRLPGAITILDKLYNWFAERRFASRMRCARSQ